MSSNLEGKDDPFMFILGSSEEMPSMSRDEQ